MVGEILTGGDIGRLKAYGANVLSTARVPFYDPSTKKIYYATPAQISAGGADVVGPSSATDTALVIFDGATGKLVKNSVVTLGSTGILTGYADTSTTGITAHSGGGQGSATALTTKINRINTCAADGDSVVLPAATAGAIIYVSNYGTNYANIFPATGEIIDSLSANTAVSCPSGFRLTFTCAVAGAWTSTPIVSPNAKFTTGTTTTTFTAGQLTGAELVNYTNTQGTPGSIQTRTASQMFTDNPYARVGSTYNLMITNGQGTGTLTVTAGSGVTLTGTATIAINTWRMFYVSYDTATTMTIQNIGTGTFS